MHFKVVSYVCHLMNYVLPVDRDLSAKNPNQKEKKEATIAVLLKKYSQTNGDVRCVTARLHS